MFVMQGFSFKEKFLHILFFFEQFMVQYNPSFSIRFWLFCYIFFQITIV